MPLLLLLLLLLVLLLLAAYLCKPRGRGRDAGLLGGDARQLPLVQPQGAQQAAGGSPWLLHKVTTKKLMADTGGARLKPHIKDPNRHKAALWPEQDKDFADVGVDNVVQRLVTEIAREKGDEEVTRLMGYLTKTREAGSSFRSVAVSAFFRSFLKDEMPSIRAQLEALQVEQPTLVTLDFRMSDRPANGHQSSAYCDPDKVKSDVEQARRGSVANQRSHVSVVLAATATALLHEQAPEEVPKLIAGIIERNIQGLDESHEAVQLARGEALAAQNHSEDLAALAARLDGSYLYSHPFTAEYYDLIASALTIRVAREQVPLPTPGAAERIFLVPVRRRECQ